MRVVRAMALVNIVFFAALLGSFSRVTQAQTPRAVDDGVYSVEQALRGQALYGELCAVCHGDSLEGGAGPPLSGNTFVGLWSGRPLLDLVDKIHNTMPENAPGQLTRRAVASLVSYALQVSGFPAGTAELSDDEAELSQIAWPAEVLADQTAPAALGAPSMPPVGNLAQVMRGIMFPSSNLLFEVQLHDPGADQTAYDASDNFSWVQWGAGIYSGWQVVDYAAIALADAAPLFLTPGRLCENGQPVPVERADWIQYTQEMVEAGEAAYRAAQSRDQEAVGEVTNLIADACYNCHEVYRDKPGGTPADPSNKAARCRP